MTLRELEKLVLSLKNRCCCPNGLPETSGIPVGEPTNNQNVMIDPATDTLYWWNGTTWESFILTTGVDTNFANTDLVLTADRAHDLSGFDLTINNGDVIILEGQNVTIEALDPLGGVNIASGGGLIIVGDTETQIGAGTTRADFNDSVGIELIDASGNYYMDIPPSLDDATSTHGLGIDNASGKIYRISKTEAGQGLSMGSPIDLGDDAEGITEPGVLTSDRYINQDGSSIIFVGEDPNGRVTYVKIKPEGDVEFDSPVPDGVTEGYTILRSKHRQTHANAVDFGISHATYVNADGTLNNEVIRIGWNIDNIALGLTGLEWQMENHYQPTPGGEFTELHLTFRDKLGVEHRLESYTINKDTLAWDFYQTVNPFRLVNPEDNLSYLNVGPTSTNGSQLILFGSATGKGVNIYSDVTATSAGIVPYGYAGSSKALELGSWDYITIARRLFSSVGVTYQSNAASGIQHNFTNAIGAGFSGTVVQIDTGADTLGVDQAILKVNGNGGANILSVNAGGNIVTPNLPTHADEAAAVTAGLATGTWYQTATGELRIKL